MAVIVFLTHPDMNGAKELAKTLVKERLAACASLIPGITSIYSWKGKLEESSEVQLILKTDEDVVARLEDRIKQLHPNETPEFVSVKADHIEDRYLKWLQANLAL